MKNPPVLTYEQFLTSNDFGTVKSESLLGAALDMFNAAKDKITFILQMIDEEKGEQGGEEEEEVEEAAVAVVAPLGVGARRQQG